jgi:hypothetical protein
VIAGASRHRGGRWVTVGEAHIRPCEVVVHEVEGYRCGKVLDLYMTESSRLTVQRRITDSLGRVVRLAVFVDGRPVGKLRRGEAVEFAGLPGVYEVRVRMSFFNSEPIYVRLVPDQGTVVSFGVEDFRRDAGFGWRAVAHLSRGPWGARVDPPAHRVDHQRSN